MGLSLRDLDGHIILNEFYTAPIQCLCMHVDYSDKAIRDAIENDLCINSSVLYIGLARTCKYNAFCKIYILYVCLQALMNVGYMHAPYKPFECSRTSWLE